MPRVNIPGVGAVNFPDTMKPEEITHAIETDILPKAQGAPQPAPPAQEPGALAKIAGSVMAPVAKVVETLDRFTGVPLRAGFGAAQDVATRDPDKSTLSQLPEGLAAFAGAAARNIGGDWNKFSDPHVPDSKEIMVRNGVPLTALSDKIPGMYSETGEGAALKKGGFFDPTAAGAAGFGMDIATPIPGLAEIKALGTGAGMVSKVVGKGAANAAGKTIKGTAKAIDIATGTKAASKTVAATGDALKTVTDATASLGKNIAKKYEGKFSPKYTEKHIKTIEENGLDQDLIPNSVKFGENSQASKYQRYEAEFLRPELADAHDAGLKQVQGAVRDAIRKLGNSKNVKGGVEYVIPETAEGAGEFLKHGFDRKVDKFFDETATRYKTIAEKYPDITIPKPTRQRLAANIAKQKAKAENLLKNSYDNASKAQAKEFLAAVEQAEGATNSYGELVTALQGIGRTAFKSVAPGGLVPPDKALFRSMYNDLSGVAMETVSRRVGKKTAKELASNNKKISEFINDKSVLSILGDAKKGPDQAFNSVFESGDVMKANALKRALTPEELQLVKASWIAQHIKKIEAADGEFTFRMLNNRLRNPKSQKVINAFFDKGELDNLKNLVELGDEFGPKVLSTSGTGASAQIQGIVNTITTPVKAVAAGANKALAVRQERNAAKAFNEERALKASKKPGYVPPKMSAVPTVDKLLGNGSIANLLKLKPRLRAQEDAYKNLNEDQK